MKSRTFFIFLSLCVLVNTMALPSSFAVSDTYDWYSEADGYEEAIALAKEGKRPIVIYFHVDWCSYCKRFDREYIDDNDIYDFLSDYLRVEINPEDGDHERTIADQYDVKGYPTFLITSPGINEHWYFNPFRKDGDDQDIESFINDMKDAIKYVNGKNNNTTNDD